MLNLMLCIAALPDLIAKCKHMWGYVQPDVVSDRIYLTLIYFKPHVVNFLTWYGAHVRLRSTLCSVWLHLLDLGKPTAFTLSRGTQVVHTFTDWPDLALQGQLSFSDRDEER